MEPPYKKSDPCPLIRLAFVRHLPPEGKVWRAHNVRPYGGKRTRSVG